MMKKMMNDNDGDERGSKKGKTSKTSGKNPKEKGGAYKPGKTSKKRGGYSK